jgi:hypothetical protein
MEPEYLLLYSEELVHVSYPEPEESSSRPPTLFL